MWSSKSEAWAWRAGHSPSPPSAMEAPRWRGRLLPGGPCVAAKPCPRTRSCWHGAARHPSAGFQHCLRWVPWPAARVSAEPTPARRGSSAVPGGEASLPTFAPAGLVSRGKSWSFRETRDPGSPGPGGFGFATPLAVLGYRNAALRFQRQLFGTSWRWKPLSRNLEVPRCKAAEQGCSG